MYSAAEQPGIHESKQFETFDLRSIFSCYYEKKELETLLLKYRSSGEIVPTLIKRLYEQKEYNKVVELFDKFVSSRIPFREWRMLNPITTIAIKSLQAVVRHKGPFYSRLKTTLMVLFSSICRIPRSPLTEQSSCMINSKVRVFS